MLQRYLSSRSDLGLRNAVATHIFESRNPFERQSVRKPQRWFVLLVITSLIAIGAFVCFNCWN